MASLLIAIIYLAFISLGLPDSLLGSAWPVMHLDLDAAVSAAGYLSIIISLCTIASSLLSERVTHKFGTGRVTAVSVFLTAGAMLAFSFSRSFWLLCLFAVPYGFGAGAIDSALNNYVALHLSSRHMSWLHCCWSIGAMISPVIMGQALAGPHSWRGGYRTVSFIQFGLTVVMLLAIPLWQKMAGKRENAREVSDVPLTPAGVLRLPGTKVLFFGFFCYIMIETLPMSWASTYFVSVYRLDADRAATLASLFYLGMTVSRAVTGFLTRRFSDRQLIRAGSLAVAAASLLIVFKFDSYVPAAVGFALVGFGCGPVYPCITHATPANFGAEYSGSVIGVQMAFAYLGSTFSPLLFGKLAQATTFRLLPFGVLLLALLVFVLTEATNRIVDKQHAKA